MFCTRSQKKEKYENVFFWLLFGKRKSNISCPNPKLPNIEKNIDETDTPSKVKELSGKDVATKYCERTDKL